MLFCNAFRTKTAAERLVFIRNNGQCENCLGKHALRECSSRKTCRVCSERHHTILHDAFISRNIERSSLSAQNGETTLPAANSNIAPVSAHTELALSREPCPALLTTAMIIISAQSGSHLTVRVLVDTGSEVLFVAESVAQKLKLSRCSPSIPVIGIGAKRSSSTHGLVSCTISARPPRSHSYTFDAHVLPRLSAYTSRCSVLRGDWPHIEGLDLVDPDLTSSKPIEVLLGADVFSDISTGECRKGPEGTPLAHETYFGWILCGRTSPNSRVDVPNPVSNLRCRLDTELRFAL